MEQSEEGGRSANQPMDVAPAQAIAPSPARGTRIATTSYVYALGRITPRFPSLAVEKEFAQATGRAETSGAHGPTGNPISAITESEPLPGASTMLGTDD